MNPYAGEYLEALATGDRDRAWEIVVRLQQAGAGPLDVMARVVAPAQEQVGVLWATDAWSVAQEHAATAVSESVLNRLAAQVPGPPETASPVVVSCVEQEWHALPALLVAEHLRHAGLPVSYLGANASAEDLVRHVHTTSARAVALSCSLSASLPKVRGHVEAIRATGTPVVVGGAAFDRKGHRARVLGATGYAASGAEAVGAVLALPSAVPRATALRHEGAEEGLELYSERERLAAELRRAVHSRHASSPPAPVPAWQRALHDHLPHLVGALVGALVADDPAVLHEASAWLEDVLVHRAVPNGVRSEIFADLGTLVRDHPAAARLVAAAGHAGHGAA